MFRSLESLGLAAALICAPLFHAEAQQPAPTCAELTTRMKSPDHARSAARMRDFDELSRCPGPDRDAVLTAALHNARGVRDTAYIKRAISGVWTKNARTFLPALLDLAADRGATPEARVSAMTVVHGLQTPGYLVQYKDMVGGLDENGMPSHSCSTGRIAGRVDDAGLTTGDQAQIRAVARRIVDDATAPVDVRTAAVCIGGWHRTK
jgi:hypothetical protein